MIKKKIPVKPITLGKIGSCHGIHGWLKVFSYTEKPESIFDYYFWFVHKEHYWEMIEPENWKYHNQNLIFKLKGIEDRNAATSLINHEIIVDFLHFPKLEKNFYYWKDLIDCRVKNIKGYDFGKIINIIETGSNDVLVIKGNLQDKFGIKKRLIPFLDKKVIKKVDLTIQLIEVDWDPSF